MSALAYTRGKSPTEVIDLPLGYRSAVAATRLINRYYEKFKPEEFKEVKVMYFHAHGPGLLNTKGAVKKLEDLKGMKIRSTGLSAKVVSALGGPRWPCRWGRPYALRRGVVDGSMAPIQAEGWKWGEGAQCTTESYGAAYSTGFFVVMNQEKWNALPSNIQKIFEKVNTEWIEKTGRMWETIDKSGREYTLKRGNQIISLSKEEDDRWAKAVRPILDEYLKNTKEKGLTGEAALKFCREQLKKLQ